MGSRGEFIEEPPSPEYTVFTALDDSGVTMFTTKEQFGSESVSCSWHPETPDVQMID